MNRLRPIGRWLAWLAAAACAVAAQAQTPPGPAKVALTSLVGDVLQVTARRETVGTNVRSNPVNALPMPNASLDLAVLKATQEAVGRALPGASVAMLRVPQSGTPSDPAQMVAGGKVADGNSMLDALRQGGYTHVVAITKLKASNVVKLADRDIVGTGHLEGLGFYIDETIRVQRTDRAESAEGIIAPHVYVQLSLIDLGSMQVKAAERITASRVVMASANPTGTDPWGALTPVQKIDAIEKLIQAHVGQAAARLFEPR